MITLIFSKRENKLLLFFFYSELYSQLENKFDLVSQNLIYFVHLFKLIQMSSQIKLVELAANKKKIILY